jgi:hypothetical protein
VGTAQPGRRRLDGDQRVRDEVGRAQLVALKAEREREKRRDREREEERQRKGGEIRSAGRGGVRWETFLGNTNKMRAAI